MKRIRIGKDISMRWEITTDGVAIPLDGRDLTVEIKSPAGIENNIPYRIDGNILIMTYYGYEQKRTGEYSITLWEKKGKPGQNVVDVIRAFELVRTSQEENDFVGGDLQIESVDLGTENFDILTEGGYRAINIDTLQAEALEDSVNINGKTYSNESFTITLPKANLDSAGVMSADDKHTLQEHGNRIAQINTTLDEHTESINARITTDRIADGAVTSEKIATTAFDSTLSVSGKIAPADIVGTRLTELSKQAKIKFTDLKFTQHDYAGIYCTNVHTGSVSAANNEGNGIVIPVKEGDVFEIIGENLKYGTQSVQFYSGYPSSDTNISTVIIHNNKVTAPRDATYMLVSVNPSLGTETTIKQLNWISTEDLPQKYKETLETIGSEYRTQVINVTQGLEAGGRIFPISMLGEGDIIQIYVESDIDTRLSLVDSNGYVIQSIKTNQVIHKEITADDIRGNAFGFFISSAQAIQSGVLNCSFRVVKKDSSGITLSKLLVDVHNAPKDILDINKNLGSHYEGLTINVEAGKLIDARTFISTYVEDGYVIEFIAECKEDLTYRLLTFDGHSPSSGNYFSTNVMYSDVCSRDFIASVQSGKRWGVYIPANNATVSTTIHFKARLTSNDTFSIQHTIDSTKKQVNSLEKVVKSVVEIPVNNKNIKNWPAANKLVTRLYVENKERALADGLYIRQFFRALNSPTHTGFNFGTRNSGWAFGIFPNIGDFDYYETTTDTYGKIAIKIADWDAISWPANGIINISALSESNLEDIVFDWNEFVKPLYPTVTIADGSVTENKLSEEVKDKLNSSVHPLSRYELFSLGDSLSSGGVWQTKVAQLTGCTFDQAKNSKAGAMLSVGGTSSYGGTFDNVLWRTKNLIDQNYITDDGKNTIVILENVNDGYQAFDGDAKTIVPTTPIEGYNDADFGVDLLNSISNKAVLNAVLRLNTVVAGRNLRIDILPTKAGNITLKVGWAGPGISNYNIYVVPQATQEETLKYVLDRILEYAYTGITDVLGEDGRSVDFSSGNSNYLPTVQFIDTDNTGMTCTVTDNPNAKGSVARYFIGENVSEWADISKWQKGITYSQGWKSSIEMLQRAYPKLHIFVSMFPMHAVTASEYLLPNGTYDTTAYNKVSRMVDMRKMQVELNNIAKFYSLPFIDVFAECGIGISNMLTYYNAQANVHPKNEGYYKFGETVATQLKRFLI